MKRLRPSRWSGQLLHGGPGAGPTTRCSMSRRPLIANDLARCKHTPSHPYSSSAAASIDAIVEEEDTFDQGTRRPLPSPPPQRSLESAKLAALHARLALSSKIPLQTLARALITPSADANASFNNQNLAYLGSTIINYHVLEHLVCKWPRLPMAILYAALRAYSGSETLSQVARRWGVDAAAAPGEEVDPGLLQWSPEPGAMFNTRWNGYVRAEDSRQHHYRRGMSSRVILDDDFGDTTKTKTKTDITEADQREALQHEAFSSLAQAVVGSIYAHCGREAAKAFIDAHILSRQVDLSSLFQFQLPTRELAMLCAREGFEPPLARLESETGRLSRTPVFVVGVYSGVEKLGEGTGASLDMARRKACMNALKSWYLYSPANKVRVPSDMLVEGAKPWKAPHIDIGEII